MVKLTKASFARARKALGIKKVTKKNIGRIAKKARQGTGKVRKSSKSSSKKVTKTKKRSNPKGGNKRMGKGKSLIRTAETLLRIVNFVGPEAAQVLRSDLNNEEKIWNALMMKSGFYFPDGSFHSDKLWAGWGPSIMFNLASSGIKMLNRILRKF